MPTETVLHVRPLIHQAFSSLDTRMYFQYSSDPSPSAFCAWSFSEGQGYFVKEGCRLIQSSFSVQALNYPVAQKLVSNAFKALVVHEVSGATLDLPRVAALLNVSAWFDLSDECVSQLLSLTGNELSWARACFGACEGVLCKSPTQRLQELSSLLEIPSTKLYSSQAEFYEAVEASSSPVKAGGAFDYTVYEMVLRDHPLLWQMQSVDAKHFSGCTNVLDLGAGVGIFLDVLRAQNIPAVGVERNAGLVKYGEALGLKFHQVDAVELVEQYAGNFDGVYCSHFVEHLPIEQVEKLLAGVSRLLMSGGVAVFTFPDPESIRSQLLGFWRDPEHVRFYHPELIANMARAQGLSVEWSSYDDKPHDVYPFPISPPSIDAQSVAVEFKLSWWQKALATLGVATTEHVSELQRALLEQRILNTQLVERTEQLWNVNKTWAWDDNATLKLRKL
ncbi:class I SAM-dependent methyltransferase [Gilvimarinus xylanilyticus]|uniref:Class I SAM-dependent methyltransferase n=1 Tax=Gilvimarinus xylanilyticus TaxID=2944139 RepID=A0A9X2HZG0_9GAMM|nr:class I SAM-dependent methyltransferase [Gilvimarinus xylanilyticus]MCP8899356.1 class I SAM-dependent methyltransferase [Gilvimarinus xylanilyticus]